MTALPAEKLADEAIRNQDQDGWRWYVANDQQYISVTQVLDCIVHEKLKAWFINNSKNKVEKTKTETAGHGTQSHANIENWANGGKAEQDPRWLKVVKEYAIEPIRSEFVVTSNLGYAGTVDLYANFRGKKYVIDIKTGRVDVKAGYQMAAYRHAMVQGGTPVDGMAVVQLHRDGSDPKVFVYEHYDFCLQRFLCAFECWKGLYFSKLSAMSWPNLKEFSPAKYQWEE